MATVVSHVDTGDGRAATNVTAETAEITDRLRAFTKALFFIDVAYVLLQHVALAFEPALTTRELLATGQWIEEVVELCLWAGGWALFAHRKLSMRTTLLVDALIVIAAGTLYASSIAVYPFRPMGVYEMLLACVAVFIFHALLVPASPRRTFTVTTLASLPGLLAVFVAASAKDFQISKVTLVLVSFGWLSVAIGFATIASAIIHRLRQDVRDAQKLGQYTLLELLGEGGMGKVYRAQHALLRRPTAIKLLQPERTSASEIARFEREVQLTSELTHPNIVSVFDFGRSSDGRFYYVMEFLDGVDLERLVRRTGPLPPARVKHILEQILLALEAAHARALVHRDMKPANVILCPSRGGHDVVKICDFGLVKDVGERGTKGTTEARQLLGTPFFMPPEAISSGEVDARGDLYSVGALTYQLLTGSPPFVGATLIEVCSHHLLTPPVPPSRRTRHHIPESLEDIVLRCLAKAPEDRFPSARAVRDRLRQAIDVPEWSDSDAAAWWTAHGDVARGEAPPPDA